MKLIHLSDLHIGKRLNGFFLLEDQEHILDQITEIVKNQQADAVIIAGDVYDKAVPSAEAVALFDSFLSRITSMCNDIFIISGNHDSPERIAFGSAIMEKSGVHFSPVYDGDIKPTVLTDSFGDINVYMLPFVKPANVRRFFPDISIESYTDAVCTAVDKMEIDVNKRNVLVTHQFVTGASTCESEEHSVGGTDNVDSDVFDCFDYVALGHIHSPQNVGSERIRYCGTPLKYSFSECKHSKSVTFVELNEKNDFTVSVIPLAPLHDMREIKGSYDVLMLKANYEGTDTNDYVHITLTDEEDVPDAMTKLRTVYPNIMKLSYDNMRTRNSQQLEADADVSAKSPFELFSEFYEKQNNSVLGEEQEKYVKNLIESIWEGRK
ncbi:MAG: exonuclease SbcCD subunit D [Ruminococcaceae bacterium]|nr:exonuclease SbcCD subunit D [Oscillospiraceae bacterium]